MRTTKPGALEANWRNDIEAARSVRFSVPMPKRRLWLPGQGPWVAGLILGNVWMYAWLIQQVYTALKGHV